MSQFESLWGALSPLDEVQHCYAALPERSPRDYRKLAALLAGGGFLPSRAGSDGRRSGGELGRGARILGIGGGQGAGKSTLSDLIARALTSLGQRVCLLSLDDFYLTRAERVALADEVHPLFETRGPPGTHDIARLSSLIEGLSAAGAEEQSRRFRIPIFDKAEDDRVGERVFEGGADWILLEGWCVGVLPLERASLRAPINAIEAEQDPEGVWRGHFADCLERTYCPLWANFDATLFLRVPNLEAVCRWRLDQEQARPAAKRWGAAEVARFVAHYERITRAMWAQAPQPGQLTATLGEAHEVLDLAGDADLGAD